MICIILKVQRNPPSAATAVVRPLGRDQSWLDTVTGSPKEVRLCNVTWVGKLYNGLDSAVIKIDIARSYCFFPLVDGFNTWWGLQPVLENIPARVCKNFKANWAGFAYASVILNSPITLQSLLIFTSSSRFLFACTTSNRHFRVSFNIIPVSGLGVRKVFPIFVFRKRTSTACYTFTFNSFVLGLKHLYFHFL